MLKYLSLFIFVSKLFSLEIDSVANFPDSVLRVRNISVIGNNITKQFIIEREMSLRKDSLLTFAALEFDKNRIYNLQLFNLVKIEVIEDGDFADLKIIVVERYFTFVFPVFGFRDKDVSKFFYGVGMMKNNLNGENTNFMLRAAYGYEPFIDLRFKEPYFNYENDISISTNIYSNIFQNKSIKTLSDGEKNFNERWNSVDFEIGKRENIFNQYFLTLGYSNVFVKNLKIDRTVSGKSTDNFAWFKIANIYDSRDLKEFSTTGRHHRIEFVKYGIPNSEIDYAKLIFDGKYFFPIFTKSTIGFRTYSKLSIGGKIANYGNEYFGYDNRIRGHYKTIAEGENLGLISAEFRTSVFGPKYFHFDNIPLERAKDIRFAIYGTMFADFGSVWDRNENWKKNKIGGYGIGLNYLAFYGMVVRTEIGFSAEPKPRPEFIIGAGASF